MGKLTAFLLTDVFESGKLKIEIYNLSTKMAKEKTKKEKVVAEPQVVLSAVYEKFLSTLSTTEQEVYRHDLVKAMFAFRRYLSGLTDKEVVSLIVTPSEPSVEK